MAKNFGYGVSKSLAGTNEVYAQVYVADGWIIAPGLDTPSLWMRATAPDGANVNNHMVYVRTAGGGKIHAQMPTSTGGNRTYGFSWNFTDYALESYLNGEKAQLKPAVPAPTPTPKTVSDLFVIFGVAAAPEPTPAAKPTPVYSAPTPKPTFTPTVTPKYTVTPSNFGKVTSLAGTDKQYTLVFVQDHKIITPAGILDGTAIRKACALAGGNLDRKYVQVRLGDAGWNSIHAQLPDDDINRPYGTSFDFVDVALAAYLRG